MGFWKGVGKTLVKVGIIVGGLLVLLKVILDAISDNTDTEAEDVKVKVNEIISKTTEKEERLEQVRKENEEILRNKEARDKLAQEFFPGLKG